MPSSCQKRILKFLLFYCCSNIPHYFCREIDLQNVHFSTIYTHTTNQRVIDIPTLTTIASATASATTIITTVTIVTASAATIVTVPTATIVIVYVDICVPSKSLNYICLFL